MTDVVFRPKVFGMCGPSWTLMPRKTTLDTILPEFLALWYMRSCRIFILKSSAGPWTDGPCLRTAPTSWSLQLSTVRLNIASPGADGGSCTSCFWTWPSASKPTTSSAMAGAGGWRYSWQNWSVSLCRFRTSALRDMAAGAGLGLV